MIACAETLRELAFFAPVVEYVRHATHRPELAR